MANYVVSAGYLAEVMVIENANATAGLKECWKHRLQVLKKDLGYDDAPMLEYSNEALAWSSIKYFFEKLEPLNCRALLEPLSCRSGKLMVQVTLESVSC
jgi:hypothetical protein